MCLCRVNLPNRVPTKIQSDDESAYSLIGFHRDVKSFCLTKPQGCWGLGLTLLNLLMVFDGHMGARHTGLFYGKSWYAGRTDNGNTPVITELQNRVIQI